MKTVVVMPNWVGDSIMAWPVLAALADSGRELSLLAKPHLASLAALAPGRPEFLARGSSAESVARLAAGGFDEAVVLPNSFRSAWLPLQAQVSRRFGYRGNLRAPLLQPSVGRPGGSKRPQVEDYRELLQAMAVDEPASWTPRIELPEALRAAGRERLARGHVTLGAGPLVGVFPGAEFGPSKRWPWRSFADLLVALRRGIGSFQGVIVAGPKELWTAVRVHEESGKIHPVIGPDLDLAALAGVLAHFDALVTNDSGPMHLAAALGVRTVALFGPTDPRRTAPAGEGHAVLSRDLWCSPCFRRRCPLLHHGCMRGIGVERVTAATLELISIGDDTR